MKTFKKDKFSSTINYYQQNAVPYYKATYQIDMSPFYKKFLEYIPAGGTILDAGSGSGRDTLAFTNLGYDVTAFDASEKMATLSSSLTSQTTKVMSFDELNDSEKYDGIWANASLLHISFQDIPVIFNKLANALKKKGVLYCSFKFGKKLAYTIRGRQYTDMNSKNFEKLLATNLALKPIDIWISIGTDSAKKPCKWFNALLVKP